MWRYSVGTVGPKGEDEITEVLNLSGVAISLSALSGEALSCTEQSVCEEPLVWAVHLPWKTELDLVELVGAKKTAFADLTLSSGAGEPGWYVECMKTLTKPTDECTASQDDSEMEAEGSGVMGTFSTEITESMGGKLATCSQSKEETGVIEGLDVLLVPGETIAPSE